MMQVTRCEWTVTDRGTIVSLFLHEGNNTLTLARTWPLAADVPIAPEADQRNPFLFALRKPTLTFDLGAENQRVSCPSGEFHSGGQSQSVPPGSYEGFLDAVSCAGIGGWAWTSSQPERPLIIDLYDGDRLLATTSADKLRPDLLGAGKGNGRHGFAQPIPIEIRDGKPHSIRAVVKNTSVVLQPWGGIPSSVTCTR